MSQLKRTLYPAIHPYTQSFRPLVRDKTDREDELVAVYDRERYTDVVDSLRESRFSRNTWLSTCKYVEIDGTRYYESDSFVWFQNGPFQYGQQHCYVVPVGDKVRVYNHKEWPIFRPVKHQSGKREAGDVDGVVQEIIP